MAGLIAHFRRPPWPALFGVSAAGYGAWLWNPAGILPAAICGAGDRLGGAELWAIVAATLALNPPLSLLMDWSVMLVAMMPPLLAAPLVHVRQSSLVRRRARAAAAFVVGYAAVWLAMAVPLGLLALVANLAFGTAALPLMLAVALAWSASPAHRYLLNRAHRLRPVSLFGLRADLDCLVSGLEHGRLCAGTCWAWMLVPLLADGWHFAAMLATGIVLLAERLSRPGPVRWRIPPVIGHGWRLISSVRPRAAIFPRHV